MGQCYNSTIVDSGIKETWAVIRDFHELGWAAQVVTKIEKVGDVDGVTPGARRILNEAFHETLKSIDDENHMFSYSIDNGPGPVAELCNPIYQALLSVLKSSLAA